MKPATTPQSIEDDARGALKARAKGARVVNVASHAHRFAWFDLDDLQSVATRVKPNKPKVPAAEPKAATAGSTETLTTVPEDEETRLKADQSKRKSNAPVVALVAILVSCVAVASLLLSRCH